MPRQVTVLRVLVSSPGDVAEERAALEQVIAELNLVGASHHGIQLELIRWETHATPGFGVDAQEVVNRGLGDDYDLFLGIMWGRFGTPTGRADSGTEEEFERALARYRSDPTGVDIMFYFKDVGIPPSKMDLEQLGAVQRVRERLGDEGGLYWTFTSIESFQSHVRIHLGRKVQEWRERHPTSSPDPQPQPPAPTVLDEIARADVSDVAELGLLDLVELFDDAFHEAYAMLARMTEDLNTFTERIEERTEEINALQGVADRHKVQLAKRVIRRAAEDMNQYVESTNAKLPTFADQMQRGIKAFGQTLSITTELGPGAEEGVRTALLQITSLRRSMAGALVSSEGFRDTIAKTPRMSGDLIKAKKRTVATLDAFLQEVRSGDALLQELESALTRWLEGLH